MLDVGRRGNVHLRMKKLNVSRNQAGDWCWHYHTQKGTVRCFAHGLLQGGMKETIEDHWAMKTGRHRTVHDWASVHGHEKEKSGSERTRNCCV